MKQKKVKQKFFKMIFSIIKTCFTKSLSLKYIYIVNMTPGFVAFVVIFTTIVVLIGIFIDISKE